MTPGAKARERRRVALPDRARTRSGRHGREKIPLQDRPWLLVPPTPMAATEMQGTALLVTTAGRPTVLDHEGGRVYISVHDEYHRRVGRAYKQQLKLAHPDMQSRRTRTMPACQIAATIRNHRRVTSHARRRYTQTRPVSTARFRAVHHAYEQWLASEATWYAQYQLTPPEWGA